MNVHLRVVGLVAAVSVSSLFNPSPGRANEQQNPSFQQGLADRTQWEDWLSTLTGSFKDGVNYWAAHRSLRNPGSCPRSGGEGGSDVTGVCLAAQRRLALIDAKRKSDPDYRAGFNSYHQPDAKPSAEAATNVAPHPASSTASSVQPAPMVEATPPSRSYVTANFLAFGCNSPENAAALGQELPHFSGSIGVLIAEANANDCFSVGKGISFKYISTDSDSGSMLMELPSPTYILGHGKITQLWFAPDMFKESYK